MKKNFLYVAALLALGMAGAMADELPSRPSFFITSPVPLQQWSGFYVGANGGYGFANSSVSYAPNDPAAFAGTCGGAAHQCIPNTDFHMDGPLAGGQMGWNWQINSLWLIGVEADYQWSNLNGRGNSRFGLSNGGSTTMVTDESVKSFGTLRARMGVIPMTSLVLYGTGGLAYGRTSEDFNVSPAVTGSLSSGGFSYSCTAGAPCFAGSSSNSVWGWSAGAGADIALSNNLFLRTELLYVHLDAPTGTAVAQSPVAGTAPASFAASFAPARFAVLRGGLNFKF